MLTNKISAVVMAAGMSLRMGTPKMLLPWKGTTVIAAVLNTLNRAAITEISIVLGADREALEEEILRLPFFVNIVMNPYFRNGEMTDSLRLGVASLSEQSDACLIVLGDQPQIRVETVQSLLQEYSRSGGKLIVPSYSMRRGHPWLVDRGLWNDLLQLNPAFTMRDFLHRHAAIIQYLIVETPEILEDLDTPEDYASATRL